MKWALVLASLLAGCVVGGGPLVGYGRRGWFAGAEVAGGGQILIPQATLGYQSDLNLVYLRADEAIDVTAGQRPASLAADYGTWVPGGRIGGGIGLSLILEDATPVGAKPVGVFAAAASIGHALRPLTVGPSGNGCGVSNTVGVVELQVRYASGWSVVIEPRVERGDTFCN